ncbi:cAMP-specific 3',5'-cyclic phosphodiesterase [Pseudolycoriella hygida]|uniref:cAMP-specific 3',5'-cyclic phosphodiesterase n=1 Tax=Pseudolycoriella hygida TaxID=35572 RepID=A0A9Q0MVX0_9DIPT|nr:cAMP-specific 3',5'-cyclic phosphodiesterase [Pseudolycoriella hygida]
MSVDEAPQYIVTAPGDSEEESTVSVTSRSVSHSTRSHSLQSSTSSTVVEQSSVSSSSLIQQHKAQSSANIVTSEKHVQQKSTTTKGKFQSFLQHPDSTTASHGATFLTAQQKHVRQFVRSTSAHSETGTSAITSGTKHEKCIRSASTQIDDANEQGTSCIEHTTKGLQQSSILISKSAETIEMSKLSTGIRTQLTLSGGLLAPPNRKLTILSPIHAPPGLHDMMLKRHGRSPLSPRISFPGSEADIFP